jgi:arabinose-5-phosphate isomerase
MSDKTSHAPRLDVLDEVKKALTIEVEAIQGLSTKLGGEVERALDMLLDCQGKVIVSGMGKSGHVGKKFAATLASTGTPATFLHPAEAIHGDLGVIARNDIVIALSNSGTTEEVIRLLGPLRRIGVPLISMTGNPDSELAKRADINLDVSVAREACPLNLAPTASTTAALALGDALAVTLLKLRNFKAEDYALFHPGGNLGKKLMTTVADLMEPAKNTPIVSGNTAVKDVVDEIREKNYGITMVVDDEGILQGAFSLGDLLRLHIADRSLSFMDHPVREHMAAEPRYITPDRLAAKALYHMETGNVRALFVVDEHKKPLGIIGIYEVLRAIDY